MDDLRKLGWTALKETMESITLNGGGAYLTTFVTAFKRDGGILFTLFFALTLSSP
jgi:hypothetical protein